MGSSNKGCVIEIAILIILLIGISFLSKSEAFCFIVKASASLLLWVVAFYGIFFNKEYVSWDLDFSKYVWINKTAEYSLKIICMIIWTVILYLFMAYGIGFEGGPWEDV